MYFKHIAVSQLNNACNKFKVNMYNKLSFDRFGKCTCCLETPNGLKIIITAFKRYSLDTDSYYIYCWGTGENNYVLGLDNKVCNMLTGE